jgi:nucleoside-diphosphate-sugar epimerase
VATHWWFSAGDQIRPFIHLGDANAGIRFSHQQMGTMTGQTYNIIGRNASILDLEETVRSIHPAVEVRYTEQDILTHLSIEATSDKILKQGWHPSFSLVDGLGDLLQSFSGFQ